MTKNFDDVHPEDRSFTIGGQTYHWRPLWWREFGQMVEDAVEEAQKRSVIEAEHEKAVTEAIEKGKVPPSSPAGTTIVDSYERLIEEISKYLEPSEVENFQASMNDPEKRVSHVQLNELREWLREVANNRPTEQPSPSESGAGSGGRTLKAVSP